MYSVSAEIEIPNARLVVQSLRVLFVKFDRRWSNWGNAEREIFMEMLNGLNGLPVALVRRGLSRLREKFGHHTEVPSAEQIVTELTTEPVEGANLLNYKSPEHLERAYEGALHSMNWGEVKRVRGLLAAHYSAYLNGGKNIGSMKGLSMIKDNYGERVAA